MNSLFSACRFCLHCGNISGNCSCKGFLFILIDFFSLDFYVIRNCFALFDALLLCHKFCVHIFFFYLYDVFYFILLLLRYIYQMSMMYNVHTSFDIDYSLVQLFHIVCSMKMFLIGFDWIV